MVRRGLVGRGCAKVFKSTDRGDKLRVSVDKTSGGNVMTVEVGVNGFGRIGRLVVRAAIKRGADLEIVAVNDSPTPRRLVTSSSTTRCTAVSRAAVEVEEDGLVIDGERDPRHLRDRSRASCRGRSSASTSSSSRRASFTKRDDAASHLEAGRPEGHHLGAGQGRRRHDRARRQRRAPTTRPRTTSSPTPAARPTAWRRWPRCCSTPSASSAAS